MSIPKQGNLSHSYRQSLHTISTHYVHQTRTYICSVNTTWKWNSAMFHAWWRTIKIFVFRPVHVAFRCQSTATKLKKMTKWKLLSMKLLFLGTSKTYFLLGKINKILQIWVITVCMYNFVCKVFFQDRLHWMRKNKTHYCYSHFQKEKYQQTQWILKLKLLFITQWLMMQLLTYKFQ